MNYYDFIIPKGRDFSFTVDVKEADSFLAQDLSEMYTAKFVLFRLDNMEKILEKELLPPDNIDGTPAVPQQDTFEVISSSISAGDLFSVTFNGTTYSYEAVDGDTKTTVINAINSSVIGSTESSTLTITGPDDGSLTTYEHTDNIRQINTTEPKVKVPRIDNEVNGRLECTIEASDTAGISLLDLRGPAEDDYYMKAGHQGTIDITFDDGSKILPITVLIERILISPTAVTPK